MMHFIETDVSVLGKYYEECERIDGDNLDSRMKEMGVDYDETIVKAFKN